MASSKVSFDGMFLEGEQTKLDGDGKIVSWDLRTIGRTLTIVIFLVGTLFLLSINFVLYRPRS